jgi:hypothetical protein
MYGTRHGSRVLKSQRGDRGDRNSIESSKSEDISQDAGAARWIEASKGCRSIRTFSSNATDCFRSCGQRRSLAEKFDGRNAGGAAYQTLSCSGSCDPADGDHGKRRNCRSSFPQFVQTKRRPVLHLGTGFEYRTENGKVGAGSRRVLQF